MTCFYEREFLYNYISLKEGVSLYEKTEIDL